MLIPVDPAGGYCFWSSIKSCKSERKFGERLSNTWVTCPMVWNNLGKLRVIPDRVILLECVLLER